jgi:hypothetical protein
MFDIYLSDKRAHLLVVRKGGVIPLGGTSARWRKKKRTVVTVSDEIRLAVQRDGYYSRRLGEIRKAVARIDLPATALRKRFNTAAEPAKEHSGKWRVVTSRVQSDPREGKVRHPFFKGIREGQF